MYFSNNHIEWVLKIIKKDLFSVCCWNRKEEIAKLSLEGLRIILRDYGCWTFFFIWSAFSGGKNRKISAEYQPKVLRCPVSSEFLSHCICKYKRRDWKCALCSDHKRPCAMCSSCPKLKIRIHSPLCDL